MKLFVEGGGESDSLRSRCRQGFKQFLTRAGIRKFPRIIASGGREQAYQDFCHELGSGGPAMLLVDAEEKVTVALGKPWEHLRSRDRWEKPEGAEDEQCHLMVVCTEAWFLSDKNCLAKFYGKDFRSGALPANPKVEEISKSDLFQKLENATRASGKGAYSKGDHSFLILEQIDPEWVCQASPWARRFVEELKSWGSDPV